MAAIALVVVGPDRLPKLMRELGRWYGQLRRAADDLRRSFVLEADRQDAAERYKKLQERRREAQDARRLAQEAAGEGTAAQPDDAVAEAPVAADSAAAVADPDTQVNPDASDDGSSDDGPSDERGVEGPVPNDLPPDAPHPQAVARADAERRAGGIHAERGGATDGVEPADADADAAAQRVEGA